MIFFENVSLKGFFGTGISFPTTARGQLEIGKKQYKYQFWNIIKELIVSVNCNDRFSNQTLKREVLVKGKKRRYEPDNTDSNGNKPQLPAQTNSRGKLSQEKDYYNLERK